MKLFCPKTINYLSASSWCGLPVDQEPCQEPLGPGGRTPSLRSPLVSSQAVDRGGSWDLSGDISWETLTCRVSLSSSRYRSTPKTKVSCLVLPTLPHWTQTSFDEHPRSFRGLSVTRERGHRFTPSPRPLAQRYHFILFSSVPSSVPGGPGDPGVLSDVCSLSDAGPSLASSSLISVHQTLSKENDRKWGISSVRKSQSEQEWAKSDD